MYALYVYYDNNPTKIKIFVADITDTSTKYIVEEREATIDEVLSGRGRDRYHYNDNYLIIKLIKQTLENHGVDYL
jgi:hypothetical protein